MDCLADISTQEACRVTQKLDLDQMSERNIYICILKDTKMIKLTFYCKFWVYSLPMTPDNICALLQIIAYEMSQEFPAPSLDVTVYHFVSSSSCYC